MMLIVVPAIAAGAVMKGASSHAAAPGMIVFASDREKANPGEIYSLAPGTAPRDVSRSLAADYGLAVSPVGDQIAFWSGRSGSDHIYLARGDGSRMRRLRPSGADFAQNGGGGRLVFSADGRRLFASLAPEALVIETRTATARRLLFCDSGTLLPSPDGKSTACGERNRTTVYDLAGNARFSYPGQRPTWSSRGWLTNQPSPGSLSPPASAPVFDASGWPAGRVHGQPVGWSRDGRYLLFRRGQSLRISASGALGTSRLLLAKWGGAAVSFTPDNRFVSLSDPQGRALRIPLAGGRAFPGLDFGGGAWSPDGRLAYADYRGQIPRRVGGRIGVYVTDTRGRNPRLAGRFPFDNRALVELQWLPGGRRVLFAVSNICGGSGLFAVPADGGATRSLNNDLRDLEMPAWSPDGTRIAYSVKPFDCDTSPLPSHLETIRPDGTGVRTATKERDPEQGSFDVEPVFGPGGRIAYLHATTVSLTLETVAAAGGARTVVLPSKGSRNTPVWSPDGSRIAFESGGSIWAVAAAGGTPERIARIPRSGSCGGLGLSWSPDGKRFAAGGADGVYVITLGKPSRARLAIRAPCAEYPSFSPDGTQIAFDAPPAGHASYETAIMVANADGTNLRTLSAARFTRNVHPTWQPAP